MTKTTIILKKFKFSLLTQFTHVYGSSRNIPRGWIVVEHHMVELKTLTKTYMINVVC